jgi:hypothetical protein
LPCRGARCLPDHPGRGGRADLPLDDALHATIPAWLALLDALPADSLFLTLDPRSGANDELIRLFNPRTDTWSQHFQIQAWRINGLTPVGRTTAYVFNMNRPDRVRVRIKLEPETFLG